MALASVCRWMNFCSAVLPERRRLTCGHLDEIAEHVVVPDLERADAALGGVARLQAGDDLSALVPQPPRLVERGVIARRHETAVALQKRQVVGERGAELRGKINRDVAKIELRIGVASGGRNYPASSATLFLRLRSQRGSCRDRAARRDRARDATARAACRARAASAARTPARSIRSLEEECNFVKPPVDRNRIGERARQPLGEEPRSGRTLRAVDRRDQRARAAAGR